MRLYHGSDCVVREPLASASRGNLDFGRGFYLTSYREQAERWALRKAMRSGATAFVNEYEFAGYGDARVLRFDEPDAEWVEYVCACRRGARPDHGYDIIIGGVADDKVFRAVDMYARGYWDMETTLRALRYYGVNDQWCFVSQAVIDGRLSFVCAREVER